MKNLSAGKGGKPVWGPNYLLCLTCEMKCPKDAIVSPATWPLFRPFMIFSVYVGMRDAELDHARILHRGGETRRLD
jgi:hypothetical protein